MKPLSRNALKKIKPSFRINIRFHLPWRGFAIFLVAALLFYLGRMIIAQNATIWESLLKAMGIAKYLSKPFGAPQLAAAVILTLLAAYILEYISDPRKTILQAFYKKIPFVKYFIQDSSQDVKLSIQQLKTMQPVWVPQFIAQHNIGFVRNRNPVTIRDAKGNVVYEAEMLSVFAPSIPTYFTGRMVVVPKNMVYILDNGHDEIFAYLASFGSNAVHWKMRLLEDDEGSKTALFFATGDIKFLKEALSR